MPELCEGNIGAASEASPEYSLGSSSAPAEPKLIRDLQVHVPPSLTDTCQLRSLSRKRDGMTKRKASHAWVGLFVICRCMSRLH